MAKSVVNVDIDLNTAPIEQLEGELEKVNEELRGLERGTKEFEEMAAESAKLTNALVKANSAAEGFTDEKKFQAADGAIKVLGGSLASVVGVLGTLGIESEAFGDIEKKAASAIAVAIGFKDLSEGFKQIRESAVLASAKTKLFGITTKQALIATGIGVFVVAVGTLVAYWDDVNKAVRKFADEVPFVGKAIETIENTFNSLMDAARPVLEFLNILPDEAERAIIATTKANEELINTQTRELALAQARGASALELFKIQESIIKAELENLKNAEAEKQEIYDKETELLVLQAAERKRLRDEEVIDIKAKTDFELGTIETKNLKLLDVKLEETEANDLLAAAIKRVEDAQDALNEANETAIQQEQEKQQMIYDTGTALGALGSVFAQQTIAAKALAISQAVINTYLGVTEALSQKSTLPSPFDVIAKVANVATVLATGFSAVRGITATSPTGGATLTPIDTGGGSSRSIPQVATEPATAPEIPTVQPAVQAYVISGDVTSGQEADARLSKRRTLG